MNVRFKSNLDFKLKYINSVLYIHSCFMQAMFFFISDHTRLSVWVLDGDPSHAHLLRFALSEETFPHTLVMFTVAMTTPWGIQDQLQSWASILQDHIDRLKLSADVIQNYKQKCKFVVRDFTSL